MTHPDAPASASAPTGERERLPNRRLHEVLGFERAGIRYVAGLARFADGRLAEIFINTAKTGTALETQPGTLQS
jgi:ribonucleoside-diphosphate reductase alpha chain